MDDQRVPPRRPVIRPPGEVRPGLRPGDLRYRLLRRPAPERIRLPPPVRVRRGLHPAVVFGYGFAALILVGTIALTLPLASASGQWTPPLTALFTATSAVCVTGLVVVDTGTYWSFLGQVIILALVQVGGLGFMTSSTVLLLLTGRRATLRERVLLREALGGGELGATLVLARRIFVFTVVAEAIGALVLTLRFLSEVAAPQAIWWGLFHAVSGFNNAGFDIFGGFRSLTPYRHDPSILLTIALLIVLGGISYTAVEDLLVHRRFSRLALDTKLVLTMSAGLIVLGTLALLFTERANPATLGAMDPGTRVLNALFQAITPRTAGFNSVDIAMLTDAGLLVLIALMFVGGAAGSTAGGIKVQTFGLLLFAIVSAVRGLTEVQVFRRRVPEGQVLRALAVTLLSLALVFVVAFTLSLVEDLAFLRILFETFSAFGTVGLSTGITPELSVPGQIAIIATMFAGRLGPLTLAIALAAREWRAHYQWPEEGVRIG